MQITVLTLFPELFPGALDASVTGRGLKDGLWSLNVVNIREFATDKHQNVDDVPYGGGAGMVMKPDVLAAAIDSVKGVDKWVYMSPRGAVWNQKAAGDYAEIKHLGLICGRFEGIDERVLEEYNIEEISIGDYVLTGGELAAYVVIDSILRHVPAVLGNDETVAEESFSEALDGGLEYPHYTRPPQWRGKTVPEVLLSGHHDNIKKWRRDASKDLTSARRPDIRAHSQADETK